MPEVQLPTEPITMHQTKEWVTDLIDELLNSGCLEQETKSIVEKTMNACAGCI
jgi:hypothetical protein